MNYNLSHPHEREKAEFKFKTFLEKGKVITLKGKSTKRSIRQNAYLYVVFSLFGIETGYTKEEAKTLLKRESGMMIYEKSGTQFLKSTASLTKDECQVFIDWILKFSAEQGIYILSSEQYLLDQHNIDNQIEQHERHL